MIAAAVLASPTVPATIWPFAVDRRPAAPELGAADRLVLAVHEATRPLVRRDPHGLLERLRSAAVGVADLLSRGEQGARASRLTDLSRARGHLAELSYYVDLAERLGVLDPAEALELFEHGLEASVDLANRLDALIYGRSAPEAADGAGGAGGADRAAC